METQAVCIPKNQQVHKGNMSTLPTASWFRFIELPTEIQHEIISTFREERQDPRDPTLITFMIDIETLVALRLCVASAHLALGRCILTPHRTCKVLSKISIVYLFWSFTSECERQLHDRVNKLGSIPQPIATHLRTLSLRFAIQLKSSAMSILSVARNVRCLRIEVPRCPPALPASLRRLCAAICVFTHLSSISFRYVDLPPVNTSSPDYLHNVLLAQLLTRPGHPLMSISLELTHISASNLSLLLTRRSRLKVLKFVNALRDQIIPILSWDRPWGFSDTLETLIVSEIPMKMVSVLLHCLARGRFGALRRLNIHTSTRYEQDLDVPADIGWAIPSLHATILPLASTWFAIKVMQVVHTRALILDPIHRFTSNIFDVFDMFDVIRFLREVPSLNAKMMVVNIDKQKRTQVESLLHGRGISLVAPEEYW